MCRWAWGGFLLVFGFPIWGFVGVRCARGNYLLYVGGDGFDDFGQSGDGDIGGGGLQIPGENFHGDGRQGAGFVFFGFRAVIGFCNDFQDALGVTAGDDFPGHEGQAGKSQDGAGIVEGDIPAEGEGDFPAAIGKSHVIPEWNSVLGAEAGGGFALNGFGERGAGNSPGTENSPGVGFRDAVELGDEGDGCKFRAGDEDSAAVGNAEDFLSLFAFPVQNGSCHAVGFLGEVEFGVDFL